MFSIVVTLLLKGIVILQRQNTKRIAHASATQLPRWLTNNVEEVSLKLTLFQVGP